MTHIVDGSIYIGQFVGEKVGLGLLIYQDGSTYEGFFYRN